MHRDSFLLMHSFIIFFVLSISSLATAQQRHFNVSLGSSLTPTKTSSWLSKSGLYAFGFYQRGNGYSVGVFLAGIPEKTVVWTANRDDPPVSANSTLLFSAAEGRLVLQTPQGQDTYIADISPTVSYASMLDTGNFVLYDSDGGLTWQSFAHPTDTLLPTQRLVVEMPLISSVSKTDQSTGTFSLTLSGDGNLVQYPKDDRTVQTIYWTSGINELDDKLILTLAEDGNLYLVNATGFNVWNVTDGQVWSVLWINSDDRCDPKGLCGLNSFCVSNDLEPGCNCLPGFAPVIQGNWTSGCERNFTSESCKKKGKKYSIRAEDNTIWVEDSYSVLLQTSKEDCSKACLDDCNCEAALYKDGSCKKQRLPLKYGRRSSQSGSIAFIKIICYRKKLDQSLPEDQVILEEWVYECFEDGELGQLVGDEEVEPKQLERIIKVALWCILDEPSLRPSMKKVLLMLEGTVDIPTPPNPTSFISTI
ncbi:hypothetical protein LWI29_030174 [Acer saccharum]|uniref:Bulb-type lectin domain-containing protein n=1 Tax=Acer saccharum TaxID=4024 RepID=A0AA39TA31_ACESA|nr:hypothetical protein LWI29_030174 [Acer saccharum]